MAFCFLGRLTAGVRASYGGRCRRLGFGFSAFSVSMTAAERCRAEDRSIDGTGNNLANPLWGSAGRDYGREASGAHYADGISTPIVAGLPSARAVSNAMMSQGENSVLDPRGLTAMVYTWGQFIDHDMDLQLD